MDKDDYYNIWHLESVDTSWWDDYVGVHVKSNWIINTIIHVDYWLRLSKLWKQDPLHCNVVLIFC